MSKILWPWGESSDGIVLDVHVGPRDGPMPDEKSARALIEQGKKEGKLLYFTGWPDVPLGRYDVSFTPLDGRDFLEPIFIEGRFSHYARKTADSHTDAT